MSRHALLAPALAAGLALAAGAPAAEVPDLERGRMLYQNHCVVCHTSKVHRRYPPSAIDLDALRFIVRVWAEEQNLPWGRREIEDVVLYLDRVHYKFP